MQAQVQTQVQPQRLSADADTGASASIGEQATNMPQVFSITFAMTFAVDHSKTMPVIRVGHMRTKPEALNSWNILLRIC